MADIRYVCLSDLHFGAENSVLSALVPGTARVDARRPSESLVALVDCLRRHVEANAGGDRPVLVLLGDVLDLSLGQDAAAMEVFSRFVELAFPPERPLFSATVLFVPGNHDHHLWETARERQYAAYLGRLPLDRPIEQPWHSTRLFADGSAAGVESETLTTLFRRHPHLRDVTVRTVYPNLALRSADGAHCVLFHHGHYVESIYVLMSELDAVAFPGRPLPVDAWDIEAENHAWIEFVWSTLGQSAQFGEDVARIYDLLQSGPATERLADRIARQVATRYRWPYRPVARWALDLVLGLVGRRAVEMERLSTSGPISAAARAGVVAYLAGPLLRQLRRESEEAVPLAFVYGHTHKPDAERLPVDGYPATLDLYNTGGFVVDSLAPAQVRGGSVVLLDDDLDVAAVRLYRQETEAAAYRVAVEAADPARPGPLAERLGALLDPAQEPWAAFSETVARAVGEREAALARIVRQ